LARGNFLERTSGQGENFLARINLWTRETFLASGKLSGK
jgi:hypothetical protein